MGARSLHTARPSARKGVSQRTVLSLARSGPGRRRVVQFNVVDLNHVHSFSPCGYTWRGGSGLAPVTLATRGARPAERLKNRGQSHKSRLLCMF